MESYLPGRYAAVSVKGDEPVSIIDTGFLWKGCPVYATTVCHAQSTPSIGQYFVFSADKRIITLSGSSGFIKASQGGGVGVVRDDVQYIPWIVTDTETGTWRELHERCVTSFNPDGSFKSTASTLVEQNKSTPYSRKDTEVLGKKAYCMSVGCASVVATGTPVSLNGIPDNARSACIFVEDANVRYTVDSKPVSNEWGTQVNCGATIQLKTRDEIERFQVCPIDGEGVIDKSLRARLSVTYRNC